MNGYDMVEAQLTEKEEEEEPQKIDESESEEKPNLIDDLKEVKTDTEHEKEEANKKDLYYLGDLKEKGFLTDGTGVYAPYHPPFYLKLGREDEKTFSFGFYIHEGKDKDGVNKFKQFSQVYTKQKPITETDKDRNRIIGGYTKNKNMPRAKKKVKEWLEALELTIIEADGLDIIKDKNYYVDIEEKKSEEEEGEEEDTPSTPQEHTDYPKNIQKMARKVRRNNENLLDRIKETTSYRLEGNETEVKLVNYSIAGLFCGGGVDILAGGDTGIGKTKTIMEVIKNYPDTYIYELNTSPKYIYRDAENLQGKKIIFANDIPLTEANINLIKALTRDEDNITYKTLESDKSGKQTKLELKLEGDYVVILTFAKNTPDEELANPFYNLNISPSTEESHKVKGKIKEQRIINGLEHEGYNLGNEINKCNIQFLIDKNFTVFNPYTLFLNPNELNNRDVDSLLSFVIGATFFNYWERKKILFKEKRIVIGSFDDFKEVLDIWSKNREVQKYKYDNIQEKVMELLPVMTREEAEAEAKAITDEIEGDCNRNAKVKIIKDNIADGTIKAMSINDLTRETGKGNKTIKRATIYEDKGLNKPCLASLGVIDYYDLDIGSRYPQKMLYRVCDDDENASNSSFTLGHLGQNGFDQERCTLNQKKSFLIGFLSWTNILINKYIEGVLTNYCETHLTTLAYDELVDFIQEFITRYDDELNFIDGETITLEDLDHHNKITKSWGDTLYNTFSSNSVQGAKTKENSLNEEQTRTSLAKSNLTKMSKGETGKEAISENDPTQQTMEKPLNDKFPRSKLDDDNITGEEYVKSRIGEVLEGEAINVDVGCKILIAVSEEDLTIFEIQRRIYPYPNQDDPDEGLVLKIERNLDKLVKVGLVEEKVTTGSVYCLTNKTKEILGW